MIWKAYLNKYNNSYKNDGILVGDNAMVKKQNYSNEIFWCVDGIKYQE